MSESPFKIDIFGILAGRRLGQFHFEIIGLCALAMFVDGFDTQALNAVAPAIARAMVVQPAALYPVLSYGGFGSFIGLLAGGPLADRIGRKPVIIGTLGGVAIFTLATAWAGTVAELAIIRFICGIALGAAIPGALALAAEFMPRKHQTMLTTIVWLGFALGAAAAAPAANNLLQGQTWPVLFMFGALMPVVILPLLWTMLPESPLVIVHEGEAANPRIRATLIRISRRYDRLRTNEFFSSERRESGFPVWLLFRDGRALVTALQWIMFFASLVTIFLVNAFLPSVLGNAGLSESNAATAATLTQGAGLFGGLVVAFVADRLDRRCDRYVILAAAFFLGSVAITLMGAAGRGSLVAVAAILTGAFAIGTESTAVAATTLRYATAMRATGIGWALGIGRNGQIVAPALAGAIVALRLTRGHAIGLIALPGIVAAAAALLVAIWRRRSGASSDTAAASGSTGE